MYEERVELSAVVASFINVILHNFLGGLAGGERVELAVEVGVVVEAAVVTLCPSTG